MLLVRSRRAHEQAAAAGRSRCHAPGPRAAAVWLTATGLSQTLPLSEHVPPCLASPRRRRMSMTIQTTSTSQPTRRRLLRWTAGGGAVVLGALVVKGGSTRRVDAQSTP